MKNLIFTGFQTLIQNQAMSGF